MANKPGVSVRTSIDRETHRKAKVAAAQAGITLADVMRRALIEFAESGKVPREVKRDK